MGYIPNKTRKVTGSKKVNLLPGKYKSVITDVYAAEDFAPGEAFVVKYQFTVGDNAIVYKETFIDSLREDRTVDFLSYLDNCGYDTSDLSTIIGMREELTLLKQKRNGKIFLNICGRNYLGHEGDAA